jgi:PAT family beta-lactamase induction signal transducer AmpG
MTQTTGKPSMWQSILNKRILVCIFTGFSSGMPLYVLFQMIPAWLRDEGIDLKTIGLFSIVSFPYTWKFLWAPLMDRVVPGFLGRRRGWALLTQIALLFSLSLFSFFNPRDDIWTIAGIVALVALFSASQDIVLDAYRRELLPDEELGFGNSMFVNAYRISSLVPGSLALILADQVPWRIVHWVVASFMLIGIITTFFMPEPKMLAPPPKSFKEAVTEPFREFFTRKGTESALALLAFILLYKLGDNMATALATPFYLDLGFTKTEIGTVAKVAALWSSITGGVIGGIIMIRIGINRSLWVFGAIQMLTILGFAGLAEIGHDMTALFVVVSGEYLGVGLGTAAFVAFMAKSTDRRYTATQFALLTSLMGVPRTLANASTGFIIEAFGYTSFFLICTALAIPGMILLKWVAPWHSEEA